MTSADFESLYFEFDILFQEILEELHIMDTYSMDSVEVNFENQTITFNWRHLNEPIEISGGYIYKYLDTFRRTKEEVEIFKESLESPILNKETKKKAIFWLVESLDIVERI